MYNQLILSIGYGCDKLDNVGIKRITIHELLLKFFNELLFPLRKNPFDLLLRCTEFKPTLVYLLCYCQ